MSKVMTHTSQSFQWNASSFTTDSEYSIELNSSDRQELVAAVAAIERGGRITPTSALTKDDFRFGALAEKLNQGYQMVRNGPGFVVIRGLPTDALTTVQFDAIAWGIGLYFGNAISQNAQGDLISHVLDASKEDATPRMYRSNLELRPHTDITAMLALACWHQSQTGGASVVVSGITVHEEIKRRAPHLLEPLYRGFHYHLGGEEATGEQPVTPFRVPTFAVRNAQLSCRYLRSNLAGGHKELGVPLTELELEALNMFDEVSKSPENRLAFFLERGEMMVLNNYAVMHARTTFTEFPEPERRRRLTRLWFDAPGFREVPEEYLFYRVKGVPLNGVPPQPGKRATFDYKKLYKDDPVATGSADLKLTDAELQRRH
jgi:hypothetical protein